jgi:hypothetical protein
MCPAPSVRPHLRAKSWKTLYTATPPHRRRNTTKKSKKDSNVYDTLRRGIEPPVACQYAGRHELERVHKRSPALVKQSFDKLSFVSQTLKNEYLSITNRKS